MPDCVAAHTGIVNFIELIHILGNCNDNIHSPSPSPANNSKYIILKLHIITAGHLFPFFRSISHDDLVYARIYFIPLTNTRTRARKYDSLLIICQFAMAWSVRTFGTEFVFCSPFLYLSRISLTTFGSTELLLSSSIILFGWMFATLWCVKYIRSRRRLTVCVPQQQSFWWCFEWQWSENKLLDISELARSLALPLVERELCLSFSFLRFRIQLHFVDIEMTMVMIYTQFIVYLYIASRMCKNSHFIMQQTTVGMPFVYYNCTAPEYHHWCLRRHIKKMFQFFLCFGFALFCSTISFTRAHTHAHEHIPNKYTQKFKQNRVFTDDFQICVEMQTHSSNCTVLCECMP